MGCVVAAIAAANVPLSSLQTSEFVAPAVVAPPLIINYNRYSLIFGWQRNSASSGYVLRVNIYHG